MKTRVQKWGNSFAVRIPRIFAREIGLGANSTVEITLVEGSLVVTPLKEQRPTLDDLLVAVDESNLHGETDWGGPVGKESW